MQIHVLVRRVVLLQSAKVLNDRFNYLLVGATQTVLPGTCAQVAGCDETNEGCKANDQWIIYLRYPDNKDDGTKVEYEVKHPKSGITEGEVVKKNTVLLTNVGIPTTWNCGSDLFVVVKWTKGNVPYTLTRKFECSDCK